MNLEQLQAISDAELNELAAVKVMLWKKVESELSDYAIYETGDGFHKDYNWNPATDMNDAMEVWNKLHSERWELYLSCDQKITTPWDCRMFLLDEDNNAVKRIITHEKTASKAITIASILAKEVL